VRVWDPAGGALHELVADAPLFSLAYAPDGRRLALVGEGGLVALWEPPAAAARVLRGHRQVARWCAFSPDGALLATASDDGTARVWDVRTAQSRVLHGHVAPVTRIAFSPDGALVATSSFDRTIRLWSLGDLPDLPSDLPALLATLAGFTTASIEPGRELGTR
jgi:WD40 repeat protein